MTKELCYTRNAELAYKEFNKGFYDFIDGVLPYDAYQNLRSRFLDGIYWHTKDTKCSYCLYVDRLADKLYEKVVK